MTRVCECLGPAKGESPKRSAPICLGVALAAIGAAAVVAGGMTFGKFSIFAKVSMGGAIAATAVGVGCLAIGGGVLVIRSRTRMTAQSPTAPVGAPPPRGSSSSRADCFSLDFRTPDTSDGEEEDDPVFGSPQESEEEEGFEEVLPPANLTFALADWHRWGWSRVAPGDLIRTRNVAANVVPDSEVSQRTSKWGRCIALSGVENKQYGGYQTQRYPKLQYVGLTQIHDDLLDPIPDADYTAIDIVLRGGDLSIDHVVTLFINHRERIVEYFDPKGLTVMDRSSARLTSTGELLPDFICRAVKFYGGSRSYTVWENTVKMQHDNHTCGVMVCKWRQERLAGTQAENILLDSRQEVRYRTELMRDLGLLDSQLSESTRREATAVPLTPSSDDDDDFQKVQWS
ncbi:MAG: hypothetical protein H7A36_02365 [Chlamydiales bacterium]|nr:hypothetical protein [Chlamydiales bacterium]